ncbi:MAG: cell wall hydrolase [Maricaulaceae bacterium]|nr:cell wall hydrolase [Maricaulaceae bacterium]
MTATATDIRRERWIGAVQGLAAAGLLLAAAVFMPLAAQRAADQDEALMWRDLASRYLRTADDAADWDAPQALQLAAVTVSADPERGYVVAGRPLDDLRTFDASHFRSAAAAAAEQRCLAEAVYYEARGEGFTGQLAVAEVVLNRVRHGAYPSTICGVVYQGSERVTGCQFTFTCDGSMDRTPRGVAWRRAQLVAEHAMMGFARPVTHRATHYHTVAVNPHWSGSLVHTRTIGAHIFYRFPTPSERAALAEREA